MVRAYGAEYRLAHPPSRAQERVLKNIATCRTAALGGHVDTCGSCGHERISDNSCRDRHCPKCQGPRRAQWLPYFHVVFTIPDDLHPLALRNKEIAYRILFEAASRTLLTIARDPIHLGAEIGVTAVLHTWGQNLLLHPHLHYVVTGGGLSSDGKRWVSARARYFLPVRVLSKLFRGTKQKRMTLTGAEFLRRFLLHVLPKGFVRIRHFGLSAGRNVGTKLAAARLMLQPALPAQLVPIASAASPSPWWERFRQQTGIDVMACPSCGERFSRTMSLPDEPRSPLPSARASPAAA